MNFRDDNPIIYLITRGEATDAIFDKARGEILDVIRVAVEENISLIQIREKSLSARSLFELAAAAAGITLRSDTCLLVNDRADVALAAGADGVHLTANSLPAGIIRENCPLGFLIGVSTHSIEATERVARSGADFAVFAPVFKTPGKGEPQGLAALSLVCEKVKPFPVIALGGIDETNCDSVLTAGASGFAAIKSLNDLPSLRSISRKFRK